MADTALILGLAGIGGTVAVGVTSNLATVWVERRRRLREDAAERARLREAVRLVRADVDRSCAMFEGALAHRRFWLTSEALTAGDLDRYRESLARGLDDPKIWVAVQSAEVVVDKIINVLVEYTSDHMGNMPPVEGPVVALLQTGVQACHDASEALLLAEAGLPYGPRRRRMLAGYASAKDTAEHTAA